MHQLGILVFPIFFPRIGQEFLGGRDIADGRVEPHVEHLAFGIGQRQRHAPVQIARHGTGLQTAVYPRLALPVDIGAPIVFMPLQNPLPQKVFVLVERKIPMFGFFLDGRVAADGALGIEQFVGAERGAAFLALVAVGSLRAAFGAGAGNVAIGQELLVFLVVILHGGLFQETALVVEGLEEVGGRFGMHG